MAGVVPVFDRKDKQIFFIFFGAISVVNLLFHFTLEALWIQIVAKLILKTKASIPANVGKEYLRLVAVNLFGFGSFALVTFGMVVSSILRNNVDLILVAFSLVQVKFAALLWNLLKLKYLALGKSSHPFSGFGDTNLSPKLQSLESSKLSSGKAVVRSCLENES